MIKSVNYCLYTWNNAQYRVAQKKKHGTAYLPQHVDAITGISV